MIDMHTHVLPNLDDGAKNEQETAELLRLEYAQGVRELVLTSHYYGKKRPAARFLEERNERAKKIKEFVPEDMKIRLGAEVYLTGINDPNNDTLCTLAIEGTKCVLVEMPFDNRWSKNLLSKLYGFIAQTGYQPIIAHVERYREIAKNPALLNFLVKMGCYVQVNTGAFLEKHTRKLAFLLLKHGLVHCLGTDTHNLTDRAPDYLQAQEIVKERGLSKEWERVQTRMRQILAGETVENACIPIKKVFWWYK